MPETPSARLGLVGPSSNDLIANGDDVIRTIVATLDASVAIIDSGLLSNRPVSTPGSPGIVDRFYYVEGDATAVNNGVLWRDNGTGWDAVTPHDGTLIRGANPYLELREDDATADHQRFRFYSVAGKVFARFFTDAGATQFAVFDMDSATGILDFTQNKGATVQTYPVATHDKTEPTTLRTISGIITTATPTIIEGTGFTVAKNATGDVTISFTDAFSDVARVNVTAAGISPPPHARLHSRPTASQARVLHMRMDTLAASDGEFQFHATGPN